MKLAVRPLLAIKLGTAASICLMFPSAVAEKVFTSVGSVIDTFGAQVRAKLSPAFRDQGVQYPPSEMIWLALKQEKRLLIFAKNKNGQQRLLLSYPILGASGTAGPKLKEGDRQVPEGFYKISRFRPNLVAHMGLEIDYPNQEDRAHAKREKRTRPGGDIIIHGSFWSTGCLAMGNDAIHELFVLAHDAGPERIQLLFVPCDLTRKSAELKAGGKPVWLEGLYKRARNVMKGLPIPASIPPPPAVPPFPGDNKK